ncbi:carbonic anhydrase, partial [uncultured Duncaniella sp.]
MIEEILKHNCEFVAQKGYEKFATSKYPDKKIAIVTCMDTRLVELLPAALGLRNGDVKIIKNAGGTITNPFDSTMRSLLVAVYELGVNEIMVIGHTGCGVQGMNAAEMLHLMRERGVSEEHISLMRHCGIDLDSWLHGFEDTDAAVAETMDLIRNHPLMAQ